MCGIAGLIGLEAQKMKFRNYNKIQSSIHHRGPDNKGSWISKEDKFFFIHTRLSILDLTAKNGNQPMKSSCGRYIICFNGEIYNHLKLREILKKHKKILNGKATSDTETLLESISLYWP